MLTDYKNVMKGNREFVANNRNSEQLFHPEFLKDLYKLITECWTLTSTIISHNLTIALTDCFGEGFSSHFDSVQLLPDLVTPIETYRQSLIVGKKEEMVVNY